jgi:hypothetical protein
VANLKQILAIVAVAVALVLGVAAYNVFKTPEAASAPIAAIPLAESTTQSSTQASATEAATGSADAATTGTALPADAVVLQIVSGESEVRFVIDEVLNDAPKTVVGTTDQVAGELAIDPENVSNTTASASSRSTHVT